MILTGEIIDAQEAQRIGLVVRVFPHDRMMEEVLKIADKIASAPFLSVRHAKALVRRYWDFNKSAEGAQAELDAVMEITRTADCREGIRAFLDKRPPVYRGPGLRRFRIQAMNLAEIALRPGRDPARAGHPAFNEAAGAVSNADFQVMVAALAADLTKLGIKPGDKIVFRMTNCADFAAAFLACVWLGAVPVLQNSQLGRSELEHIVNLSDPALFLLADHMRDDGATAGLKPDVKRMIVTGMGLKGMGLAGMAGEQSRASAKALPAPSDAKPRHARLHRLHVGHHRQTQGRGSRPSLARSARRFKPRPRAAAAGRRHPRHRRMELHQRARPQCAVSAAQRHHRLDHGRPRRARAHPADHRARPRHAAALGRHALPPHPRHARHREPL